jgi:5'-nucleotidase
VTLPELPAGSGNIAAEPPKVEVPAPAAPAQPAAPAAAQPAAAAPAATTHLVVRGDNYWNLAEKFYGDGFKWNLIADANNYRPLFLPVGATLTIPPAN